MKKYTLSRDHSAEPNRSREHILLFEEDGTPIDLSGSGTGVSVTALAPALNVMQQASSGTWPSRRTLAGQTIPWPLTWVSYPGNTTPPPDGYMVSMDAYIPVPA